MAAIDINFACPNWWEKLQKGETPIAPQVLNEPLADIAVKLFDKLRVPDIPGQPTMGAAAGDWIRDIIRAAFGSVDPETGARLVGEIFNLIPKKNAKTTNAAALGLVALQMNQTPNVDGVIIGPTQEVALKCFEQASAMIDADDYLRSRFKVHAHLKTIVDQYPHPETGRPMNAKLKIKSFDPAVVTGGIPAFSIIDELHVMAAKDYANRVIRQIRGGMITNPQSLLIFITTQSENPPVGVFKEELEYARKVRDGEITKDVRMLPVLYEFPEEVQTDENRPWEDPKLWPFVLPNLNRSVHINRLIPDFEKAKATSDAELAGWASQHLNIQIGMGHHVGQWIGAGLWADKKATATGLTLETFRDSVEVCVAGIDGGGMDDWLGLTLIGREKGTGHWLSWSRAWAHPIALDRRKSIKAVANDFAKSGDLVICEYDTQDIDEVVAICAAMNDAGLMPERAAVGLDPEGVAAIVDGLEEAGFAHEQLSAVSQGYKLNGAIKGTERKLFNGSLKHADQPMMAWCVSNAKTEARGNAVVVTKAVSGTGKIDPLMALFNGVMLMSWNPKPKPRIDGFLAAPVMAMS